jgi:hypothetical protein
MSAEQITFAGAKSSTSLLARFLVWASNFWRPFSTRFGGRTNLHSLTRPLPPWKELLKRPLLGSHCKTRLQKALVGNGNLWKSHWEPQHRGLLNAELAGCLERADLTDGHSFGTRHAVHRPGRDR